MPTAALDPFSGPGTRHGTWSAGLVLPMQAHALDVPAASRRTNGWVQVKVSTPFVGEVTRLAMGNSGSRTPRLVMRSYCSCAA